MIDTATSIASIGWNFAVSPKEVVPGRATIRARLQNKALRLREQSITCGNDGLTQARDRLSAIGTKARSDSGGFADELCSGRVVLGVTQLKSRPKRLLVAVATKSSAKNNGRIKNVFFGYCCSRVPVAPSVRRTLSCVRQTGGYHILSVLVDERGGVLSEPHLLDTTNEDAVGSKVRDRCRPAKQTGLSIDEIRHATRE